MTITPKMNLTLPVPNQTSDLEAAELLVAAIETIDSHTHTNGKGEKIPSAGLNINGTVDANDEGFTNTKFVKLTNLTTEQSELTLALYAKNGDLIFRNSTNEEIALTTGTSVGGSIQGSEYGQSGSRLEYVKGDETDGTYTFYDGDTSLGNIEAKDIEANDIDVVDITAETLTLTTDLTVANGGTGASSLTDHGVMVGSGTDAVTLVTELAANKVLCSNLNADPSFRQIVNADVDNSAAIVYSKLSIADNDLTIAKTNGLSTALSNKIETSKIGSASGVCPLGADSKVDAVYLPSYVDDILEYDNFAAFPVTGESGKVYVAKDTNVVYRWSGTVYTEISASLALGETSSTAYRGDRGKTAYDHSQTTHDKTFVGLGNVDNTSDANKPVSSATQTALNGKSDTSHNHSGTYEPANANIQSHISSTSNPHSDKVENLSDVNITDASVEDGQAIVWDDASGKWVAGASGDASFKVTYLSTTQLTVKAGKILHNGSEYATYHGTNTEAGLIDANANLNVTPTVSASASYYLYIDTSAAVSAGLLTSDIGRKYYGVTNAMFMSSLLTPSEVDTTRYIPIGVYTTDASSNIVSTKVGNVAPRSVDSWSNIKLYEDKIVARYTSNGGESFPTTTPIVVDFETANISSPYITTGSGWKFTAPRNGKYQVSVNLLIDPVSITADDVLYLYLFKGGVNYTTLTRFECGVTTTVQIMMNLSGISIIELLANEYIDVRIEKVGTTSFNVRNSSVNSISIHEITNYPTSAVATPTNTPFAILTANPTPVTTGCVSGYERVLVDSSIHDQMNCEAFYWDASDTNASWEKKNDAPMMVHNGFIAMLSSYIDALDWATGDKLKVIAGNGARINAIPAGKMPGLTTGQAIGAGYVGERRNFTSRVVAATTSGWTASALLDTLPAGVWTIYCKMLADAVNVTGASCLISDNNNNDSTGDIDNTITSVGAVSYTVRCLITPATINISTSKSLYAKCNVQAVNANMTISGYAVRVA